MRIHTTTVIPISALGLLILTGPVFAAVDCSGNQSSIESESSDLSEALAHSRALPVGNPLPPAERTMILATEATDPAAPIRVEAIDRI